MKSYVTDAEIQNLEMEIFHDNGTCWKRSLEDSCDYDNDVDMDYYFPTDKSLRKMSESLDPQLIAMRAAARMIDSGFRGTMGEEFLLSQDPWELD